MKRVVLIILGIVAGVAVIGAIVIALGVAVGFVTADSIQKAVGRQIGWGGQATVGRMHAEDRSVGIGDARSTDVTLTMGAGNLQVADGARALMSGHFTYNVADWRPAVTYYVSNRHGRLTVRQPSTNDVFHGADNAHNAWTVRLNNQVPMHLRIDVGAGTSTFALGRLSLTDLAVNVGAGATSIDLNGAWKHTFDATIHGGVGELTMRLPSQVGVRVTAHDGFGDVNVGDLRQDGAAYVNGAYGASPVTVYVTIAHGIGHVMLV